MVTKSRPATASAMPGAGQGRGQGLNEVSRVAISARIWAALGILIILLMFTGVGMFMARGELENVRSALQQAEARVKQSDLRLKDAMDDKQQVIKELGAQGNRIARSTLGEEQARSALAAVSTDAQASQKRLADLKAHLAKAQRQLRALRKENATLSTLQEEVAALTGELYETRATLEQTQRELERMRALAEPYSAGAQRTGPPAQ